MAELSRVTEAFRKIQVNSDAIAKHLNDDELDQLQERLINGLLANKRRRAIEQRATKKSRLD